jgi:cell division protein ZapA
MATVELMIGGRSHQVGCRDGEEEALSALGRKLDELAQTAARAAGAPSGERMMLFIALMLADELAEANSGSGKKLVTVGANASLLDRIADRLEAVAAALEHGGTSA